MANIKYPERGGINPYIRQPTEMFYQNTRIRYVYFLLISNEIVYIGSTDMPIARLQHHRKNKFKGLDIKMDIYGVYPYWDAWKVEKSLIKIYRPPNNAL